MKDKRNLLVSFSGGETSGFMAQYLKNNKSDVYNMVFVFANTGEENEETLRFVDNCDKLFNLDVIWVEADVQHGERSGTKHKVVNFKTASRNGEPFEEVIKKYGIPNQAFPHCNRELKLAPIHSYIKNQLGWKNYDTAIGIRYDEVDRIVADRKKYNIIYPLIEDLRMTKPKINFWWSNQSFRLNLKGYQGNCKTCWKKSKKNLYTIAQENPSYFNFFKKMEDKYGMITPLQREKVTDEVGEKKQMTFFRGGVSVDEIIEASKTFNRLVRDSSSNTNYQIDLFDLIDEVESCDIFSNCGDL
jgi:hypothetical protein